MGTFKYGNVLLLVTETRRAGGYRYVSYMHAGVVLGAALGRALRAGCLLAV